MAAQGAPYGPSEDRGIYRSHDGGSTWEKILYVNETSGAAELSMDPTNPLERVEGMREAIRRDRSRRGRRVSSRGRRR